MAKKSTALPVRKTPEILIPTSNPLIFISHDSRDGELAEAFSKLLSSISAGMLKTFRSSDKKGTEGIEFGVDWYPEVMSKLDLASDVVCLLTPRSLERPWILYEAGVAKGKANTPVYGVAMGVTLSQAATGPFAQFQNCGDDTDSLTKLVLQLMCRVNGAEPDKDTVKMQVAAFKVKADSHTQGLEKATKATKTPSSEVEGSSVAKLFEEVKVMFRDLPMRIDHRTIHSRRINLRHYNHESMFQFERELGHGRNEGLGLLVLISVFRDEAPWLYELGLQAYRAVSTNPLQMGRLSVLRRFSNACELATQHPLFRDLIDNRNLFVAIMEAATLANRLRELSENRRTAISEREPPKEEVRQQKLSSILLKKKSEEE